nr:unnamed protein product [Callosobruchus chinensis]
MTNLLSLIAHIMFENQLF